jgi:hypothetical protein
MQALCFAAAAAAAAAALVAAASQFNSAEVCDVVVGSGGGVSSRVA